MLWQQRNVKLSLTLLAAFSLFSLGATTVHLVEAAKCGGMKWGDTDHGDNNPSSKKFDKEAYSVNLCELAKGIDHSELANHDSVNWQKFQNSPAFQGATDKQKECLTDSHKDGNGMNGLGGYEIMDCAIGKGYKE